MAFINVKVDMNQAARNFPQLTKKHQSLAARAINATLSEARKRAIRESAAELKLPQRILDRRRTRRGTSKTARSWISKRASPWNLNGALSIYVRGIPFFQVAGAQTKRGVRGKGGRLEQGAFKVPSGRYAGIVFRRIRPRSEGSGKAQLEVPRIHVERVMRRNFERHIEGLQGRALFREKYTDLLRREAGKYGVRA